MDDEEQRDAALREGSAVHVPRQIPRQVFVVQLDEARAE